VIGGGSSSQNNGLPANSPNNPNDPSLTGSSTHVPPPQESGQTLPIHTQNPAPFPYSKLHESPWSPPRIYERLIGQYDYSYQTPQSGSTSSNQWPRGLQIDYPPAWAHSHVTGTQTTVGMNRCYPSPQPTPASPSVGNVRHHTAGSSPFYAMMPQVSTLIQPASYQPRDIRYSGARRTSSPQLYSPTPQQPVGYPPLPSPPRSNSSYSHSHTSPLQPGQTRPLPVNSQWPPPYDPPNRSTSNPTPVTHPHNDANPQSPIYPPDVVSSGNSSQASNPTPFALLPPYLGEALPYQPTTLNPPNNGPTFPVPQLPPHPAPVGGNGAIRNHHYPQSGRQTGRRVSSSDDSPMASSSRVTLDPTHPATRRRKRPTQTPVSALTKVLQTDVG